MICLMGKPIQAREAGLDSLLRKAATPAPVEERMPVVSYDFNPKSLILPASLITVGAIGTAIDGMNDFHLFNRKDSVKRIHIDDYMEWGMLGWVFVCDLMGKEKHHWVDQLCLLAIAEGINGLSPYVQSPIDGIWTQRLMTFSELMTQFMERYVSSLSSQ